MSPTKSSLYLIAANILTLVVQMVSVRYFARWLGEAQYSIVVFVMTVCNYVVLVSPATATSAQKLITAAHVEGDDAKMWRIQRTQLWMNILIILGLIVVISTLGRFMIVPKARLSRYTIQLLFTGVLVAWVANFANESITPVLASMRMFKALALRQSLDKFSGAVFGVILAYFFRNPVAVIWGTAGGSIVGLTVNFVSLKRAVPEFRLRPEWDKPSMRELQSLVLRGQPHRVLVGAANSLDRVLIPYSALPPEALARYSFGYRLPEVFQMLVYPITDPALAELLRELDKSPERFSEMVDRYGRLAMGLGVSFVMIPSAFGWQFLRMWLSYVPAQADLVMLGIGVYFTGQLYMSMMTKPIYAVGDLQYAAIFSGLNAILTGGLTLVFIHWLKLPGVALMNALIATGLIVPYALLVQKTVAKHLNVRLHSAKAFGWYVVGLAVTGGAYEFSRSGFLHAHAWTALFIAPILSAITLLVGVRLKMFALPDTIRRRIPYGLGG